MTGLRDWVTLIVGLLGILGVVVTLTRYLTQLNEKAEREKVAAEKRDLATKLEAAEARRDQLLDQIAIAGRAGNAALSQKSSIDGDLQRLMGVVGASGGSVYVPVRSPRGAVHGLAFLCIEPFSVQTQQLKSKIIPLKSLAGRCFLTGESFVVVNAAQHDEHFKAADGIAAYRPSTTLNVALKSEEGIVGVLQLLSKEGEAGFSEADLQRIGTLVDPIAANVSAIARSADYLKLLGLAEDNAGVEGSVLYFDLSSSSILFQELSTSFALQLLNEYFEQMGDAAFHAGGTLDTYMGDGALLRFTVPRPQPDHELAAVTAAIEMNKAFAGLRDYWTAISPQLASVHNRAGIATGPLLRANLGHSQVQSLTVLGYPISTASALCQAAPRDRSVVLVSDETYMAVKDRVVAQPVDLAGLAKAAKFTAGAYEILGLR